MKPDDLIKLPDDRAWRLVDVEWIEHSKNGFYDAKANFQLMNSDVVDQYRQGKDIDGKIKSFNKEPYIKLDVNIEYIRCFPIGTIWQKGQQPIIPNYFGEFSLTYSVLKGAKRTSCLVEEIVANAYISSKINKSPSKSECLVFEPINPVFAKKLEDGSHSISKDKGGRELSFIAFFGYEIYRYFLTSVTGGTLNHRMLSSRKSNNRVFDELRTKLIDGKRHVYLKNEYDHPNVFLIGNSVYDEKFKFAMRRISSRIIHNGPEPLFKVDDFPIDSFTDMKIFAKRVKKKGQEDIWGLVVYQIDQIQGFQKGTYFPVTNRILSDVQNDGNITFSTTRKKNKKKPKDKFENDPVNSDGQDDVNIENDNLFGLMYPPLDKSLPQMSIELEDNDGKVVFIGKKESNENKRQKVGPSGEFEDPDGSKITIILESMNYFPLFDRIVDRVKLNLNEFPRSIRIEWFDLSGIKSKFNPKAVKDYTDSQGKKSKAGYACVEIKVGEIYFYLFEKEVGLLDSENRTWLFSFSGNRVISDIEMEPAVTKFLFDTNRSMKIGGLSEDDLGLNKHLNHKNHLPPKLIIDKNELLVYQEVAIEKHSERIVGYILNHLLTK